MAKGALRARRQSRHATVHHAVHPELSTQRRCGLRAGCVQVEGPRAHPWVRRRGGKYMPDSRGMRGGTMPANVEKNSAASLHMKPGALHSGNPRLPATARTSRRTATRALHTRAQPSARALRPSMLRARNFLAQPSQQPVHIADTQIAFAQHILPPHRTTHLPRSSPP